MFRGSSIYDIIVNAICLMMLAGITVYLIVAWSSLPDLVPGHYNAAGEVDRWDGKGILIILVAASWALLIIITVCERFPRTWNTAGIRITEENSARIYKIMRRLLSTVKLVVVAAFVFITLYSSLATSLPGWFLPVFLFLCLGPVVYFTVRLYRAR